MTQSDLGRRLGYTSHVPIVNLEAGKTRVTVAEMDKIAQILRVPLFSLIPQLDQRSGQTQSFSVSLRADPELLPGEQATIERLYEAKQREKQDALERLLGVGVKSAAGSRALARHHLRELGIKAPPLNLSKALSYWKIDYEETDLGERVSGLLIRDSRMRWVFVNRAHSVPRKRMTIAHELGHFHLGWKDIHCTMELGIRDSLEEELAYEYAYELLVPSMWLKENREWWARDPVGLAWDCQVSPIAIEKWAVKVGLSLPVDPELRQKHAEVRETWKTRKRDYNSAKRGLAHTLSSKQQPVE